MLNYQALKCKQCTKTTQIDSIYSVRGCITFQYRNSISIAYQRNLTPDFLNSFLNVSTIHFLYALLVIAIGKQIGNSSTLISLFMINRIGY